MLRFVTEDNPQGGGIVLHDDVIDVLLACRQLGKKDKESGGQLFGVFQGKDTIITHLTTPCPLDKRSRYSFRPNRLVQRIQIQVHYKKGLHFLGDWHTHPQVIPEPSMIDEQSALECFCKSQHDLKAMVQIIIGTGDLPDGIMLALSDAREWRVLSLITNPETFPHVPTP